MTDKEINEAIGIYFGYRKKTGYVDANGMTKGEWVGPDDYTYDEIPDNYCEDLNAMYDIEKTLYYDQLVAMSDIISCEFGVLPFHASARQRAEAFLRLIGKWVVTETKKDK